MAPPATAPKDKYVMRRLLILTFAALVLAAPAAAGTIVVKLTFAPGKLAESAAAATVTSAGSVQVPVTIADARGTGKGWTLRVSAARNVTITGITARCAANSTCTLPTAVTTPSGKVVLQSAQDTGMGVMNLVVTVAALKSGAPATPLSFSVS
jgi:hypothetical protein